MTIGIYLRISKKEGESIRNQRKLIYEYIEKNEELASDDKEEFIDEGKSGRNMNREGMIRLKEKIFKGEIKTVIFKDF
ncbi:MAG: recombinase family protein, partial [Firmicutes bacterium]|nr:recombinase family protein [Bacillota bacterium]